MSADDGIYILQSKDGFRVIWAQAIENIYKLGFGGEFDTEYLKEYFGKAEVFPTVDAALEEARRIHGEKVGRFGYVEYGIRFITGHEDMIFPNLT